MSGARGTESQQQDRRNAADRAGRGLSAGARGTMGQQQDRRNTANALSRGNVAPGVGMGNPLDSRSRNLRYNQNVIATRPLTPRNVWEAITSMPVGPMSALSLLGGAIGIPGLGPQYEGPIGHTTGYSYDGPNAFYTGNTVEGRMRHQAERRGLRPQASRGLQRGY